MNLLALDTTARVATAALFRGGVLLLELEADAEKKHAETAAPLLDRLLAETDTPLEAIDAFAVDIGPGSFTGVRIGASLVNAMAYALGKRVIPVDALLALYVASDEPALPVCAMLDARNGNAYAALYQGGRTLIPPSAVEIEPFLSGLPAGTRVVGDARPSELSYPRASSVGRAALTMQECAVPSAEPLYLRLPQAERLRREREGKREQ